MARTPKGANSPLAKLAQDQRIGFPGVMPSITVTGHALPDGARSTQHVGLNYFVVLNAFPSAEQDAAIAEIRALIASSGTPVPEVTDDEPVTD